jgi:DNA-binding NarL/FixJ family response regulator
MKIKVAITDDHPMVLDGLTNALVSCDEIEIVGIFEQGNQLMSALQKKALPDILLLDIQLPDKSGLELVRIITATYPSVKIIILSGIESPEIIQSVMNEGCKGYLMKSYTHKDTLISAIKKVNNGGIYLENSVQEKLLKEMLNKNKKINRNSKLSSREKDVLKLIAMEYTNQEIADLLHISHRTVENHRHNILQKLEAKNTVGLIKAAIKMGIISE